MDLHATQQIDEVIRPREGDGAVTDGVFEQQVPTDKPSANLTKGGIGISIGAAANGDARRKLRVAKSREQASNGGQYKENTHSRTAARRCLADRREDTGPDDGRDAKAS